MSLRNYSFCYSVIIFCSITVVVSQFPSAFGDYGGTISLDRTVYPVPFGTPLDFGESFSNYPLRESIFPIHPVGFDMVEGLQSGEYLTRGDLTIHIRVNDPDYDLSSTSADSISQNIPGQNVGPVKISVLRGSESVVLGYAGGPSVLSGKIDVGDNSPSNARQLGPLTEVAPDAGIFEMSLKIRYSEGPEDSICPELSVSEIKKFDSLPSSGKSFCILHGDALKVEYTDSKDSNGRSSVVDDAAAFMLRDGILQISQSTYEPQMDLVITLLEPDLDLDNDVAETHELDLVAWMSRPGFATIGDPKASFDPEPSYFRETGDSTAIFQTVIRMPSGLFGTTFDDAGDINLEYHDWGPEAANYVGESSQLISVTLSNADDSISIAAGDVPPPPRPLTENDIIVSYGTSIPGCETSESCYEPFLFETDVGTTVTWINYDVAAHTVTSGSPKDGADGVFDSGLFSDEFSFTFDEAGFYPYFCIVHPWMEGLVIVEESPPPPPRPLTENDIIVSYGTDVPGCETSESCYEPFLFETDVGTTVTWINYDVVVHTVTSGTPDEGPDGWFDSGLFSDEFSFTFDEPGAYPYFCMVHPWMEGLVIVEAAAEDVAQESQLESSDGGCLIATATFGSELSPQVQQLRELRDNSLLKTESGSAFLNGFNQFYYSFSPTIADLERDNPVFREVVKTTITPLITSLSLLNYVNMDSEVEVLGYGISLILLNLGMYFAAPAIVIWQIRKRI